MFKNVSKDQNCDWLNFIFLHVSLENEAVGPILYLTLYKDVYELFVK